MPDPAALVEIFILPPVGVALIVAFADVDKDIVPPVELVCATPLVTVRGFAEPEEILTLVIPPKDAVVLPNPIAVEPIVIVDADNPDTGKYPALDEYPALEEFVALATVPDILEAVILVSKDPLPTNAEAVTFFVKEAVLLEKRLASLSK